ncbi:hypothetical protein Tco_0815992 [Tanacetum coccineum]
MLANSHNVKNKKYDLRVLRIILVILPEHQSDTKVIHNNDGNPSRANIKQALGRFNTTAGNPDKEILLKLNLPDHRSILTNLKEYIKMDMEVPGSSRLTRFIATCSYSTDISNDIMKAQYEHVGPKVTRSQEGKRSQDDDDRLCLVDDLKKFKITFMSSQRCKSKPKVNDHYIISQAND